MFYYVYVLRSLKDNKFYTGFTADLRTRLTEHQEGKTTSTKSRVPFQLIFYEAYRNKYDALRREKYLKTSKGETTLRQMLKEFLENG